MGILKWEGFKRRVKNLDSLQNVNKMLHDVNLKVMKYLFVDKLYLQFSMRRLKEIHKMRA
jgi:hypothetical protein